MTVKALIEKLKGMDQDAIVVINYGEYMTIGNVAQKDNAPYSDGGNTLPNELRGKIVIIS